MKKHLPNRRAAKGRKGARRGRRKWQGVVFLALFAIGAWWWSERPSHEKEDALSSGQAALQETRLRAEQGDGPAQMALAERYCSGNGVKRNVFQCAEWYRKAANLGNGIAMLSLGDLYATGEGFILDKDAAAMWWRKAESTADGAAGARTRLLRTNAGIDQRK